MSVQCPSFGGEADIPPKAATSVYDPLRTFEFARLGQRHYIGTIVIPEDQAGGT